MSESTAALLQTVREGLHALSAELAAGQRERLVAGLAFPSPFPNDPLHKRARL